MADKMEDCTGALVRSASLVDSFERTTSYKQEYLNIRNTGDNDEAIDMPAAKKHRAFKKYLAENRSLLADQSKEKTVILLNLTIDIVLESGDMQQLPRSLDYIQKQVKFVVNDKSFVLGLYNRLEEHVKNVLVPDVQRKIRENRANALSIFVEEFRKWKRKLLALRVIFLVLDNNNSFRIPIDNNDKFRTHRQLVSVGVFLFAKPLINSHFSKKSASRITLFSPQENEYRNAIIVNYFDLFKVFLNCKTPIKEDYYSTLLIQDTKDIDEDYFNFSSGFKYGRPAVMPIPLKTIDFGYYSKIEEAHKMMEIFSDTISEIETSQNSVVGAEAIHLSTVTRLVVEHLARNEIKAQLTHDPLHFFLNLHTIVLKLSKFESFDYAMILRDIVLGDASLKILENFVKPLMDNFEIYKEEVRLMFPFLEHDEAGLSYIKCSFKDVVRRRVIRCFNSESSSAPTVGGNEKFKIISELNKAYSTLYQDQKFVLNDDVSSEGKVAFIESINLNQQRSLLLCDRLLKYCDFMIMSIVKAEKAGELEARGILKGENFEELETTKSDFELMLKLISNHYQGFCSRYQVLLSKRIFRSHTLGLDMSFLLTIESTMLDILSRKTDIPLIDHMKAMINDAKNSLATYTSDNYKDGNQAMDTLILSLSMSQWPKPAVNQFVKLPTVFQNQIDDFINFGHFEKKKVEWMNNLHRVLIEIDFADTGKSHVSIETSIYQSTILFAFEDKETLTFDELLDITKMDELFLMDNIKSLTMGKYKLLLEANAREYSLNRKFKSKKSIVLPPVSKSSEIVPDSAGPELSSTIIQRNKEESVQFKLLSFIMGLLKRDGTSEHNSLIDKILEHIKDKSISLPVSQGEGNSFIKTAIESLINDGYIKRDGDFYTYIP